MVDKEVAPQTIELSYRGQNSVLAFTMEKTYSQTEVQQHMPAFGAVRVTYVPLNGTMGSYLFVFVDDECAECALVLDTDSLGVDVEESRVIDECQAAVGIEKTLRVCGFGVDVYEGERDGERCDRFPVQCGERRVSVVDDVLGDHLQGLHFLGVVHSERGV